MKRLRQGLNRWTRSFVGVPIIAAVGTAGIAVYVISPRFHALRWPSLIDEWTSMYWGPNVLHQLEHFSYNSVRFDATRSRPPADLALVGSAVAHFWRAEPCAGQTLGICCVSAPWRSP